jgi:hypothetical protein
VDVVLRPTSQQRHAVRSSLQREGKGVPAGLPGAWLVASEQLLLPECNRRNTTTVRTGIGVYWPAST